MLNNSDLLKILPNDFRERISDEKKKFTELNIDSLDSFTIILELSEKLNVDFPEEQISKFKSIQDITDYLNSINHSI